MNKEFVPYEIALALKELGFNEECLGVWNNQSKELFLNDTREIDIKDLPTIFILAPLFQQVFRWFREKHDYFCSPTQSLTEIPRYDYIITKELSVDKSQCYIHFVGYHNTLEEAELECIKKLIKLCKKN